MRADNFHSISDDGRRTGQSQTGICGKGRNYPGILGAIDCTHVAIQAPAFNNPEMLGILFLNRKNFYSINTQIVVDSNLKILAVNARFSGFVHDSAIWGTSQVKRIHCSVLFKAPCGSAV